MPQQLKSLHYCPLCEENRKKVFYRVEVNLGYGWEILMGDMCQRGLVSARERKEELEGAYECPARIIRVEETVLQ